MPDRIERKYLAHFIDASFGGTGGPTYVRLGKDLESYGEELNPQVDVRRNILGEQSVIHSGYQVQSTVDPYYATEGDALFTQLKKIVDQRLTGDDCVTTRIDVLMTGNSETTSWEAWREDCWVVPNSFGGDTTGVQIPFTVYNAGNRVKGTFAITGTGSSKTYSFTPE